MMSGAFSTRLRCLSIAFSGASGSRAFSAATIVSAHAPRASPPDQHETLRPQLAVIGRPQPRL